VPEEECKMRLENRYLGLTKIEGKAILTQTYDIFFRVIINSSSAIDLGCERGTKPMLIVVG
jgi:hypothetical protein